MYKFKIESMNCMSCVHTIEDALKEYDATIKVESNVKERTIFVEAPESQEKIKELIEDAGYPAAIG